MCLSSVFTTLSSDCLREEWAGKKKKKKGDQAAIAEDKKKTKKKKGGKKGKGKSAEGKEGGDGALEGKKAVKNKNKAPVVKNDGGVSSDEEIQPRRPLPGPKTEL